MEILQLKLFNILWWLMQLLGLLNICLVFIWTVQYLGGFGWHDDPLHEFNYHPVFSVAGLVLHGNGLLVYRCMRSQQKKTLKCLHATFFTFTFLLTVLSLITVFDSHDYRIIPIPNLYSLHSWIGLGTVILFAVQLVMGFAIFVYPGYTITIRRNYMAIHQFLGLTIFSLTVMSCHSGIMEKVKSSLESEYKHLPPAAYVANFLGVCNIAFAVIVIFLVAMPQFKRTSLPEEDTLHIELSTK